MGNELIDEHSPSQVKSIKQSFEEAFPYMLAIGMTYDQFWNDSPELALAYIKSDEIRKKRRNEEMWLQGAYFYHALCDVSPILHAFAKRGTKAEKYIERPFALSEEEQALNEAENRQKRALAFKERLIAMSKRKGG